MSGIDQEPVRPASFLGRLLRRLPGQSARKSLGADGPSSEGAIQQWLIERVASALDVPTHRVDIQTPFAEFGLDSRTAMRLSGDLERLLGKRLSPTLIWDFPTIEAVARHLGRGEPGTPDDNDATRAAAWDEA